MALLSILSSFTVWLKGNVTLSYVFKPGAFLTITFAWKVCMCMCVCPHPTALMTIHVKSTHNNLLNQIYSFSISLYNTYHQ